MHSTRSRVAVAGATVIGLGVILCLVRCGVLDLWSPAVCRHCGSFEINVQNRRWSDGQWSVTVICMNPDCRFSEETWHGDGEVTVRASRPSGFEEMRPARGTAGFQIDPCSIAGAAESQ